MDKHIAFKGCDVPYEDEKAEGLTITHFIFLAGHRERFKHTPRSEDSALRLKKALILRESEYSEERKEGLHRIQQLKLRYHYSISTIQTVAEYCSQHDFLKKCEKSDQNILPGRFSIGMSSLIQFHIFANAFPERLKETQVAKEVQWQFDELVLIAEVFDEEDFVNPGPQHEFSHWGFDYTDGEWIDFHRAVRNLL